MSEQVYSAHQTNESHSGPTDFMYSTRSSNTSWPYFQQPSDSNNQNLFPTFSSLDSNNQNMFPTFSSNSDNQNIYPTFSSDSNNNQNLFTTFSDNLFSSTNLDFNLWPNDPPAVPPRPMSIHQQPNIQAINSTNNTSIQHTNGINPVDGRSTEGFRNTLLEFQDFSGLISRGDVPPADETTNTPLNNSLPILVNADKNSHIQNSNTDTDQKKEPLGPTTRLTRKKPTGLPLKSRKRLSKDPSQLTSPNTSSPSPSPKIIPSPLLSPSPAQSPNIISSSALSPKVIPSPALSPKVIPSPALSPKLIPSPTPSPLYSPKIPSYSEESFQNLNVRQSNIGASFSETHLSSINSSSQNDLHHPSKSRPTTPLLIPIHNKNQGKQSFSTPSSP
ncbi:10483_t:CDS:1, partial [Racocetra fulgida]